MRLFLLIPLVFCTLALSAAPAPRGSSKARAWLRTLTLEQKAAQLVLVPFYGEDLNSRSVPYREYASLVRDLRVGGLIILNRVHIGMVEKAEPHAMASFVNRMQRQARIPLLVGADFERGASMRLTATAPFPHAMAFGAAGDLALTRALGRATAREARAVGAQWVYAPDADVNNNPDNPIINIRSFGEDPQAVAAQVRAFIEGAHSDPRFPVLVTAKHFPGHGDTATDSHLGLGVVTAAREHLDQVELVPFRAAIGAGVDSIMTAHLAVPALEPQQIPATVSPAILATLLRVELGFRGLITTDAMDMKGLTAMFDAGEAAVRAIEAGADVLLVPADPRAAVKAVAAGVRSHRISARRLDESVLRVLDAKVRMGLARRRTVSLEALPDLLDTPEDQELAATVARKALTLVKNDHHLLPLAQPASACYFILAGSRFSMTGQDLAVLLRRRTGSSLVTVLDPDRTPEELDSLAGRAPQCSAVVVASYVVSSAYRGSVALPGNYPGFLDKLLAQDKPVAFVSFGNPYLLRSFPKVGAYLAAFSTVAPSEAAVVDALLGKAAITGKLPVTIPELAPRGTGLTLP
jgi:beta-N-acetylhexosaminidase